MMRLVQRLFAAPTGDRCPLDKTGAQPGTMTALRVEILVYTAAVAAAELMVARVGLVQGLLCHAVVLLVLLNSFIGIDHIPRRRILPALALAPLLRILSITMAVTVSQAPNVYQYMLINLPLLLAVVLTARVLGFARSDLGLRQAPWRVQTLVALSGLPLSVVAFLILHPRPLAPAFDWPGLAVTSVILFVFVAFPEELIFRGLLLQVGVALYGRSGILWSAGTFAVMYIGSLSLSYVLFMGAVGLVFGWCVQRTASLWGVIIAHGGMIIGMICIWPLVYR